MAYASPSDVALLCRILVSSASNFSASTNPTLSNVETWLSSGCAAINTRLASRGYGPIPATSGAYELAQAANAAFAAWRAERGVITQRSSDDESNQADMHKRDFEDLMEMLLEQDLSQSGVPLLRGAGVYAGGISRSDKDTREADSDRVAPRFKRGQFRNPDRLDPDGSSASGG